MKPTNEKLRRRAVRIVSELTGTTEEDAEDSLRRSDWELPVALVSAKWGLTAGIARLFLSKKGNNVALALSSSPRRGGS